MQTKPEFHGTEEMSGVNPEHPQSGIDNSAYQHNTHHIGNTRPSCPLQNPYYQAPVNPTAMNNPGQNPYIQATQGNGTEMTAQPKSGFDTGDFVKGALIGAAVTYVMTNKNVQDALFKTVAKSSSLFQAGMEEVKERFEDAKAEVQSEHQAD